MSAIIRMAGPQDLRSLASLVEGYSSTGQVLPQTERGIRQTIGDWILAEEDGAIVGCGSLLRYTPSLYEIRSLVVASEHQGRNIGSSILGALIEMARARRVGTVFALTRAVPFFLKADFELSDTSLFPEKVLKDCAPCPIKDRCDELPVVLQINPPASM